MGEYQNKQSYNKVPSFEELIAPCFESLRQLSDSATSAEIYNKVMKILN